MGFGGKGVPSSSWVRGKGVRPQPRWGKTDADSVVNAGRTLFGEEEAQSPTRSYDPMLNPDSREKQALIDGIDGVAGGVGLGIGVYSAGKILRSPCLRIRFGIPALAGLAGEAAGSWVAREYELGKKSANWLVANKEFVKYASMLSPAGWLFSATLNLDDAIVMPGEGPLPATKGMDVAHDKSEWGMWAELITNVVVGAVTVVAVAAATVATAGAAAVVVGAVVAAGVGFAGGVAATTLKDMGANLGEVCGKIITGSPNVTFEGKPVARVGDEVICRKCGYTEEKPTFIAEGSETITVNGLPMARIGHKAQCGCTIADGVKSIKADLTTGRHGYVGTGHSVWGHAVFGVGSIGLAGKGARSLRGEPVDVVTGEYADYRTDFTYESLLPLELKRVYMGRGLSNGYLGVKWHCNWSQRLWFNGIGNNVRFEEEDGQVINFSVSGERFHSVNEKNPHYALISDDAGVRIFDRRKQQYLHFSPTARNGYCYHLARISDRSGNWIDFIYEKDALRRILHSDGMVFDVRLTSQGWLQSVISSAEGKAVVTYEYDERGFLTKAAPWQASTFHYGYTKEGWLNHWHDMGATHVDFDYDDAGRVVASRTPQGLYNDRFEYFPDERKTRYIDATGAVETFWYNLDNVVVREEDGVGAVTHYEWDRFYGRKAGVRDALGRQVRFDYHPLSDLGGGELSAVTDWAGRRQRFDYDEHGQLICLEHADGLSEHWRYDGQGNLIEAISADGFVATYAYDGQGRLVESEDASGHYERYSYDGRGRLKQVEDALGTSWLEFDVWGRLLSYMDAEGHSSEYAYEEGAHNRHGKLSHLKRADGGVEQFGYDGEGLLVHHRRSEAGETRRVYGAFDLLDRVIDGAGKQTRFFYDGAARLSRIVNARGQTWRLHYDKAGRLVASQDFAGRLTRYRYDELGRQTYKLKPDGEEHHLQWDERDRLITITTPAQILRYVYDDKDRLIKATVARQVVDGSGTATGELVEDSQILLFYDAAGRLVKEIQNGHEISHIYDAAGRRVNHLTQGGTSSWVYDPRGLLAEYGSNGHGFSYDYNRLGALSARKGLGSGVEGFVEHLGYDACGRLARQTAGRVGFDGSVGGVARSYQWDKAGRLTQIKDKARDEVTRYAYDRRDQIVGVEGGKSGRVRYDYDELLNLASSEGSAHHYSPGGEVIRVGDTHYQYDVLGRVVMRRVERAGFRPQIWHYEWDSFDHLASVRTPDGSLWRYVYDAFGRRVSKECVTVGRETKTVFVWDGARLVEEWLRPGGRGGGGESGGGEVQSGVRWHYAGGGFVPTAKEIVSGCVAAVAASDGGAPHATSYAPHATSYAPHATSQAFLPIVTDHLGTPRELFDESGTTCLWRSEASLWGRTRKFVRSDADAQIANCPLRFQGQYEDAETGLYYNLNRYYDPLCGMYLSPDPIGLAGGLRPHSYVHNPTSWIDPLGLASCSTQSKYWNRRTVFGKNKVYQRDDLIDPNYVDSETGLTNLQLMRRGRAPYGPDGKRINLHHGLQTQDGPIFEVTQTFHQRNSRIIHINPGNKISSAINRSKFGSWKRGYWKQRANDFKVKNE